MADDERGEVVPEMLASERDSRSKILTLNTPRGEVRVQSYCSPDLIETLELDSGIGVFAQYRSIVRDKDVLANLARRPDANVVLAYNAHCRIVGYIVITNPDPTDRWGKGDSAGILEFGVLEVSRGWRGCGIARALMDVAFNDENLDDKIVISMEYSWHWDLEGSGLTKKEYRDRLLKLLKAYGFQQFPTNDPNILLDPANMFTARIGPKVTNDLYIKFQVRLFGTDVPWAGPI